jgi:hypothetical protein
MAVSKEISPSSNFILNDRMICNEEKKEVILYLLDEIPFHWPSNRITDDQILISSSCGKNTYREKGGGEGEKKKRKKGISSICNISVSQSHT